MTDAIVRSLPATITITGPGAPYDRAIIAAEFEQDRETLLRMADTRTPADEPGLAALDADLTEVARLRHELVERRQAPLRDVKAVIKEVESWFLDYVKACDRAIDGMKRAKSNFLTERDRLRLAERERAQAAADAGDSSAVLAHVVQAQALEAAPKGTRYAWEVKRINPDLLPDEWWCPDTTKIAAVAEAAGSGDEAPIVPGVIFERVAVVQARR